MKKNMKSAAQGGFTLIELIVVIAILGILAATALPKFVDVSSDARNAAVNGAVGSINAAAGLAHAQALVKGQTGATGSIDMEGSTVALVNGYPSAAGIKAAAVLTGFTVATTGSTTTFTPSGGTAATCSASYTEAGTGLTPTVTANVGC